MTTTTRDGLLQIMRSFYDKMFWHTLQLAADKSDSPYLDFGQIKFKAPPETV